jgi:Kef-type K+ transport system membrane component KefB
MRSTLILGVMIAFLPALFRLFAVAVLPYAPKSEFTFVLMVAVLCALVTRELGAYYLVGAFVVGVTAQRFREQMPTLASEQLISAVELFASFFVPFYFFHAGLRLRGEALTLAALGLGAAFLLVFVPLRVTLIAAHRRLALGEPMRNGARIGLSIVPTLIFTLVIAEILQDRFGVSQTLFGGLVVYTLANTLLPGFVLRMPVAEIAELHAPPTTAISPPSPSAT